MPRVECITLFDITETGVTGHCRPERFPFTDRSGSTVRDDRTWNHARNQQRNLETIIQLLSMRTQLDEVTVPDCSGKRWSFCVTVDHLNVFGEDFDLLESDSQGVPMIVGLNEKSKLKKILMPGTNIWFQVAKE